MTPRVIFAVKQLQRPRWTMQEPVLRVDTGPCKWLIDRLRFLSPYLLRVLIFVLFRCHVLCNAKCDCTALYRETTVWKHSHDINRAIYMHAYIFKSPEVRPLFIIVASSQLLPHSAYVIYIHIYIHTQIYIYSYIYIVRCRYNVAKFLHSPHYRHPTTRPWFFCALITTLFVDRVIMALYWM